MIKWVRAKRRDAKVRAGWKSLEAPLRWLRHRRVDINFVVSKSDNNQLEFLVAGLQDSPDEFTTVESLKSLLAAALFDPSVFCVVGFASFFQKKSWGCSGRFVFCFDS